VIEAENMPLVFATFPFSCLIVVRRGKHFAPALHFLPPLLVNQLMQFCAAITHYFIEVISHA
jgi:hypothetical protein